MSDRFDSITQALADTLHRGQSVVIKGADQTRLFMVPMNPFVTGMDEHGILVAREKGGCFFYNGDREVNTFRLISAGFDIETAATLANVLNAVYARMNNPASPASRERDQALDRPDGRRATPRALAAPEG